jgi:hypothetical protein
MMRRLKLYAKWRNPGNVEWQVYNLGGGWGVRGGFGNCVSARCLVGRVRQIIKAPRQPPRRIYKLADSVLGYLFGMVGDLGEELRSYRVSMGVDTDSGGFPELYLRVMLTYDVYDCDDETCEGWWAEVAAEYSVSGEWCVVWWDHYMGPDLDSIDRNAIMLAAYKALRHAYNMPMKMKTA